MAQCRHPSTCIMPTVAGAQSLRRPRAPPPNSPVEGGVRFANGVSLSLGAEGAADATLLTVFDPHLQVSGRSTLHMRLTGAPDRPIMTGALNIQTSSLGYKELPFRFNNLQGPSAWKASAPSSAPCAGPAAEAP